MKKFSAKTVTVYGLLTATAMLFGYVEMLLPMDFIAPGIKVGVANTVCLFLVLKGKRLGAFLVNCVRILLTALLFGNALSLIFSITAGIISLLVICLGEKVKGLGIAGISVLGSTAHNITQLAVATVTVGGGVWYYAPILVIAGVIAGLLTGALTGLILKHTQKIIF